jgi:hypothetical protein
MEHRVREQERSGTGGPAYDSGDGDPDVIDASVWPGVVDPDYVSDTVSAPEVSETISGLSPEVPTSGDPLPGETDEPDIGGLPPVDESDTDSTRAPSKPIVTARLGTHEVTWDGLAEESEPMDADFAYLKVHYSQEPDFEISDQTFYGVLREAGSIIVTGTPYGTTWYYKFVAYDDAGNASEPSYPSDPILTEAVVDTDIIGEVISGANIVDGTLVASDKIVANSITSAELASASVIAGKIAANAVTASTILAGALVASKISTGELAANVRIIAGPTAGTHAEMSDTGFRAFVEDPVDNVPNEAVRMGTDTGDLFALFDSTGGVRASIADTGFASFSGLNVDADMTMQGIPLLGKLGNSLPDIVDFLNDPVNYARDYEVDPIGIIEQYGKGVVAWDQFNSNTDFPTRSITTSQETALFELAFDLEPGRQYMYQMSPLVLDHTSGGTFGAVVRGTTDGTGPTLSSPVRSRDFIDGGSAGQSSVSIHGNLINGGVITQTQVRLLFGITAGSSFTGTLTLAQINQDFYASIVDVGPVKTRTGTIRTYKTGGTTGGGTAAVKTYTKTYTSTSSATYQGGGTKRTDTPDVVQGYNSFNGDGKGLWIFPSMTADLTGATVNKVEVYAYANHWYYNSGGTGLVKVHGYTSAPASSPSMTTAKTVSGWPKPGGLWVTLPSSLYAGFKSGTYRGFGFGPSGGTNLLYYGRFNGGTGAKIRVTYTK